MPGDIIGARGSGGRATERDRAVLSWGDSARAAAGCTGFMDRAFEAAASAPLADMNRGQCLEYCAVNLSDLDTLSEAVVERQRFFRGVQALLQLPREF